MVLSAADWVVVLFSVSSEWRYALEYGLVFNCHCCHYSGQWCGVLSTFFGDTPFGVIFTVDLDGIRRVCFL
jgi:hypothetical protein